MVDLANVQIAGGGVEGLSAAPALRRRGADVDRARP
jgi:2-polyprenyl-6-methoxyphenol hydroxylase-like FAD-dependent oxidoreductase